MENKKVNEDVKIDKTSSSSIESKNSNLLKNNLNKLAKITDDYIIKFIPCNYCIDHIPVDSWKDFFNYIDNEMEKSAKNGKFKYSLKDIPVEWVEKNSNIILMIMRKLTKNGFTYKLSPIQFLKKNNPFEIIAVDNYIWETTSYILEISWNDLPENVLKIEKLITPI